jgi:hypothetical protein
MKLPIANFKLPIVSELPGIRPGYRLKVCQFAICNWQFAIAGAARAVSLD